ncbi:guanine methyltransferase Trm5 [Lindgomyces ingoldianus]|uniref:Guanine methyltransferase Trm5 n=1 Tax=Lindgomyces ingoldianus TaxID=673940 RepID=A0ACB6QM81_9PLEO|nr:guanine methyltransferase Trm5 [Lindgomyces ingoldianus]KAF2468119.1 guanine methyltransferase Trm5 [Lindgomyces ingoldianus]
MSADMIAPPVNHAMKVLDRSFFQKTVPTSAARIFNPKNIATCRTELHRAQDAWLNARIAPIRLDPDEERARVGGKCILLRPEVLHNERSGTVGVIPYDLRLDYSYFNYLEIMNAIIPPSDQSGHDDLPTGFSMVGHVAHLNLRDKYLPYKHLIAAVLADKNPTVTTVINKLDNVGSESAYRTFQYEVLYGPDDMDVTVSEQHCTFSFNFANVYWNSRLQGEHERLCDMFQEGDAICDVMAGVGPFAIPAGKKKCFVWANDLNPDSYKYLLEGIQKNKVADFVRPLNEDGHEFIRTATADLLKSEHSVPVFPKKKISRKDPNPPKGPREPLKTLVRPRLFSHYVMNLPASAIAFLPSFIGLYSTIPGISANEIRRLFTPHTETPLPMIHVYCFSTKSDDNIAEGHDICRRISRELGHEVTPATPELQIWDVRDVAPKKRMFCASFRLPEEVAFKGVED